MDFLNPVVLCGFHSRIEEITRSFCVWVYLQKDFFIKEKNRWGADKLAVCPYF